MFEKIKYFFLFLSGTMIKFSATGPKQAWDLIAFIPNPNFVNNVIISLSDDPLGITKFLSSGLT